MTNRFSKHQQESAFREAGDLVVRRRVVWAQVVVLLHEMGLYNQIQSDLMGLQDERALWEPATDAGMGSQG
jgi:hypothetical protein